MATVTRTATAHPRGSRGHALGFWAVAAALLIAMAFSAVPTPLYSLYADRNGFGPLVITLVFAVYAAGVIVALVTVGHLSDWHGRRGILISALLTSLASCAMFLLWEDTWALFAARFINGLAIGATTATATAWLAELHAKNMPGRASSRAEVVGVAVNLGGIGTGPLVAGALAEWVGRPLTLPYVVFGALLVGATVAVALTPETRVVPAGDRPGYRAQRVQAPDHARSAFWGALAGAFVAFAALGLFTSLAPRFLSGAFAEPSLAVAGAAAFMVFAGAVAAQLALRRRSARMAVAAGSVGMTVGAAIMVASVWLATPSLVLFLLGGAALGTGAGATFKGSFGTVVAVTDPRHRAEALAGLFLSGYVGLAFPVVGLGLATQFFSLRVALLAFAVMLVAGLVVTATTVLRR